MKKHLENIFLSLHNIETVVNQYDIGKKNNKEEYYFESIVIEDFNDLENFKDFYGKYKQENDWIFLDTGTSSETSLKINGLIEDEKKIVGGFGYSILKTDKFKFIVINSIILKKEVVGKDESKEDIYLADFLFNSDYVNPDYAKIKDLLFQNIEKVDAIFFAFDESSKDKVQAERLLHQIGAKLIPFNDFQSLTNEQTTKQTKLVCFPQLIGEIFLIKSELVRAYLINVYPEINVNNGLEKELKEISYDESEFIYLSQIPIKEEPEVNFNRVSICLEILVDDDYLDENYLMGETQDNIKTKHNYYQYKKKRGNTDSTQIIKEYLEKHGYCLFTHSYETDLFSYKYQNNPPYYTKNYESKEFEIEFSKKTSFISEGRKEQFYNLNPNVVKMQGFANYTYFFNSKVRVWHIVMTPKEGYALNELEIIQITKYFAGLQESAQNALSLSSHELITFKSSSQANGGIYSFFNYLTGITLKFKKETPFKSLITSGIVAIDMNFNEYIGIEDKEIVESELSEKFEDLYNIIQKKEGNLETQNPTVASVFKAFCGITLGIFDFARMGIEEISDTLAPREKSITPSSFLTINRGILTSFALGDDVFNSAHRTLGMNPYLMIPSAVLAHNDYVSRDAETKLNEVWIRCDENSTNPIRIQELIEKRNQVDDLINDDILANVFQYPTEQELYAYGMKHRGIQERIEEVRAKLIQLDKIIEQKLNQKNALNEKVIQLILTFLSLLQIASFCADFISLSQKEEGSPQDENSTFKEFIIESSLQKSILIIAVVLFIIILYFVFNNSPIKQKRRKK